MQDFRSFLKEIVTLKTVWIDKGEGRWVVKKRMHPFLKGIIGVTVLAVGAIVYINFPNFSKIQKAEAEPEVKISRLIDYEPDKLRASLPTINIPESKPEPAAAKREQERITMPLKDDDDSASHNSRRNIKRDKSNQSGMIITDPEKLFRPVQPARNAIKNNYDDDKYRITVSKSRYTLSLLRGNKLVKEYPIAVGRNPGDKQRVGDHRTPTGNFKIVSIEDASKWKHDFGDGKGKIAGAYGPWFLRLDAKGWKGIGIHGTHDPDSRGTMATEGCIRLSNEDIAELRSYAYRNMPVTISEN